MIMQDKTIYVLEDDPGCLFVYQDILDIRYNTKYFRSFQEFFDAKNLGLPQPNLFLIDITLKDGNLLNSQSDFNLQSFYPVPFLIVSSTDDLDTLRHCMNNGALDYLTKPFKKNELIVKLEISFNRLNQERTSYFEDFHIPKEISHHNLTKKEYNILKLFYLAKDKTLTRDELMKNVWGRADIHPKTLDVHLYNLRKKLQTSGIKIFSLTPGVWILKDEINPINPQPQSFNPNFSFK